MCLRNRQIEKFEQKLFSNYVQPDNIDFTEVFFTRVTNSAILIYSVGSIFSAVKFSAND